MTHVIILDSTSQLDAAVDATHSTLTQPGPPVYQPSEDDLQLVEEALEKEYSKKNRLVANLDNDDLDALLRSLDRVGDDIDCRAKISKCNGFELVLLPTPTGRGISISTRRPMKTLTSTNSARCLNDSTLGSSRG